MRLCVNLLLCSFLVQLLTLPLAGRAAEDVISVIVNKRNPVLKMSVSDLRPIFQTNQISWQDGSKILPLNLPMGDATRTDFDAAVLGLDPDQVQRYWIDRKIRGGARPPQQVSNVAVVLTVVSKKTEAIGYVPSAAVSEEVRVVANIVGGRVVSP